MVLLKRSRAPVFKADRPFLFLLRQSNTGIYFTLRIHQTGSHSGQQRALSRAEVSHFLSLQPIGLISKSCCIRFDSQCYWEEKQFRLHSKQISHVKSFILDVNKYHKWTKTNNKLILNLQTSLVCVSNV